MTGGLSERLAALTTYTRQPENRKQVIGGAILLAVLLVAFTSNPISNGVGAIFAGEPEGPKLTAEGLPDFASYEDIYMTEALAYTITGPANVRAFPTSQGTEVLYSLSQGSFVTAREVMAFDPDAQWLKLGDGEYVWGRNLQSLKVDAVGDSAAIPDFAHGTWSSMDTCRGFDADHEIEIGPRTMQYYGSAATLGSISADDSGKPIYNFAFSEEGRSWFQSYAITVDDQRNSLFIDVVGNQESGFRPFYRPDIGCAALGFN